MTLGKDTKSLYVAHFLAAFASYLFRRSIIAAIGGNAPVPGVRFPGSARRPGLDRWMGGRAGNADRHGNQPSPMPARRSHLRLFVSACCAAAAAYFSGTVSPSLSGSDPLGKCRGMWQVALSATREMDVPCSGCHSRWEYYGAAETAVMRCVCTDFMRLWILTAQRVSHFAVTTVPGPQSQRGTRTVDAQSRIHPSRKTRAPPIPVVTASAGEGWARLPHRCSWSSQQTPAVLLTR